MSYISAWRKQNDVYVWERVDGKRELKTIPGIFEFYAPTKTGTYTSIFGEKLEKFEFANWFRFNEAKQQFKSRGVQLYESDIGPELKVLAEQYHDVKAPDLHYTLWDIEVDYDPKRGFSSVEDPYAPINAIALYHDWSKERVVLAVPPKGWDPEDKLENLAKETGANIIICQDERELLLHFLAEIEDSDVISGWNSDWFDTPYVAARLQQVLGEKYFSKLSFPTADKPKWREVEMFGQVRRTVDLGGRISWDYMELFKKLEMSERPSYSLEAISNELLPDLPKLSYDGTLAELYNNDFEHFMRYNIRDTDVLAGFENKLGYLRLANELYHLSCGQPNHIFGTIKLADLAIINFCHYQMNRIVPDWDETKLYGSIAGAMVLTPKVGMHDWIGSIDITSLYPSAIRCVNISPETLIGQMRGELANDDRAKHSGWEIIYNGDPDKTVVMDYDHKTQHMYGLTEEYTGAEWREILNERGWSMSGYGTIFDQNKDGIVPEVLSDWFSQRKAFKKKMKVAKDAAVDSNDPAEKAKLNEQADYFDRLQYVYKIKLNSLYGALTNFHFRFFDLRLGQSTTGSGRAILDHMCSQTALVLDGKYDMFSDSIAYGDTDSVYFRTNAEVGSEGLSPDEMRVRATKIADRIGELADASFDEFCEKAFLIQPKFRGIIKCDRECVAKRGIFVSKKRYVLKLVDLDGWVCDKIKAMGLEMKKTTTPRQIQKFLEEVVNMILDGEASWTEIDDYIIDYRQKVVKDDPVLSIGLPKGVKKVEYYTDLYKQELNGGEKARLPGHVAASIHFNECLKKFGDVNNEPIKSGSKIKVFYLTKVYGKFKSIAVPTDMEQLPFWFDENFEVLRTKHEQNLIDKNLEKIFVAIKREVPTAQSKFNNSLMEW